MTSHDPETLRRIMLLLKGKRKAGKAVSKAISKGLRTDADDDRILQLLAAGSEAKTKLTERRMGQ